MRQEGRCARGSEISVCTKQQGGMGEVGCEKSVYRGNKMVCTKHLVAVSRRRGGTKIRGGEVGGNGDEEQSKETKKRENKFFCKSKVRADKQNWWWMSEGLDLDLG
ncbi:hypothetical protein PMAC_001884 [Pneumocystis sp. 'macacae']|nr:hypothetical protein PMAC_001884 [Pneumocystis sp. 'macacae']